MVATFLLPILLLALSISISAKPVLERKSPVKLALTKRRVLSNHNVIRRGDLQPVVEELPGNRDNSDLGAHETLAVFQKDIYIATISVGSPSQSTSYDLIIDSGSSNTWVGATKAYVATSTSQQTVNKVSVAYGSGIFSGTEVFDQVSLSTNLVITNQSIGVASTSHGFTGLDGILGIGPVGLTAGTLTPDTGATIPTVTDNLFASGTISDHLMAISFEPFDNFSQRAIGEISWGGTNSSKFVGDITFAPITATPPANSFWGIDASVTYGSTTTLLPMTAGIVDTGTTLVLLAPNAFQAYMKATGAVLDETTKLLTITPEQFEKLQSLSFSVAGVNFTLNADAQILPRGIGDSLRPDQIFLIVGEGGRTGMDFILGMTGLERFYVVFDSGHSQVGLAYTPFTNGTFNSLS